MDKQVKVRDVFNYFHYRQICGNDQALERIIAEPAINRPGFELSGYFGVKPSGRINLLGEKENRFISQMSEADQRKAFDYLTNDPAPMILVSHDLPCPPILKEYADRKNFPIFSSYAPTSSLMVEIITYLEEYFAPVETLHGNLLLVNGMGVLLEGESGSGKSEISLELLKRGHILVADDRVDAYRAHNKITGTAPEILRNMLELRGVGVLDVARMFGIASTTAKAQIDCVIALQRWQANTDFDRLGLDNEQVETIFGIDIPKITIPVREGRSIAVIIEAAVTNFIMKAKGIDTSKEFNERIMGFIREQERNEAEQ
jgi:HPr kinase/phosphorylase